ncbi:hypothetical protein BpHYR1_042406 [Brachionus plicatilis]|uniref:Uncharacterized protein n=1 Tax=Brachionus plicatilis TaxID=10195 RepID=A0A3M7RIA6_BRAPC|nr:hypothetical protein BpHYR1_042406 [Brachionus plicatilis]
MIFFKFKLKSKIMTENIDLKIFKKISEIVLVHLSYGCNINFTRDFECTLSRHANPAPCEICGELIKNIKGVKLHTFTKN